jgi:hypothetical protein
MWRHVLPPEEKPKASVRIRAYILGAKEGNV